MNYEEWVTTVPNSLKQDPLWQFNIYPKALFLYDLLWQDCDRLTREVRGRAIAEQIIRSAGSICANMEEGFGRGFGLDFAHFLRISLGSARETRGWYYRAHHLLDQEVCQDRLRRLDEIVASLVKAVAYQRQQAKSRKPARGA